jgi:hypothetical protein
MKFNRGKKLFTKPDTKELFRYIYLYFYSISIKIPPITVSIIPIAPAVRILGFPVTRPGFNPMVAVGVRVLVGVRVALGVGVRVEVGVGVRVPVGVGVAVGTSVLVGVGVRVPVGVAVGVGVRVGVGVISGCIPKLTVLSSLTSILTGLVVVAVYPLRTVRVRV